MMRELYWACADILALASRLPQASDLPAAQTMRHQFASLFDTILDQTRANDIPKEDFEDAKYAIVAFIDEQSFKSSWDGRQDWLLEPLQFTYYGENTAGEGFFTRMDLLMEQPRRAHVLQIYYLCLTLGFQGKYAVESPDALRTLMDRVQKRLSSTLPPSELLSPHGIPSDARKLVQRRAWPLIAAGLGVLVASVTGFIILKLLIVSDTGEAKATIERAGSQIVLSSGQK